MKSKNFKKRLSAFLIFALTLTNILGLSRILTVRAETLRADDLFISEYIEGSSYNKAIEIFNGTGSDVNLSEYKLELYANGASTASNTLQLEGTIQNGEVYVLAHNQASDAIKAVTDTFNSTVINFNGDDAVVLKKGNEIIDVVGSIGVRDNFGADKTLVRKSSVTSGTETYNPDEWIVHPNNTFTFLGYHTMEGEPAEEKVAKVTASPAPGLVEAGTKVSLSTTTEGAKIFYTTEVDTPYSTEYTGPIEINKDTTIWAVAKKDGMKDSDAAEFKYIIKGEPGKETVTIAAARALPKGTDVIVQGVVLNKQGSFGSSKGFYIQDDTAGALVFTGNVISGVLPGVTVKVSGKTDDYNGKFEVVPGTVEIVDSNVKEPEPIEITIPQVGEGYEGRLVGLKNLTITEVESDSYKNANITVSDGTNTAKVKLDSRTGFSSEDLLAAKGDNVDIVGVIEQSGASAYTVMLRSLDDIVITPGETAKAPVIRDMKPVNMSSISDTKPEISAIVEKTEADLDMASLKLYLDGTEVTPSVKDGVVTYTPAAELPYKQHIVKLEISDVKGVKKTVEWYFTISKADAKYNFYYGVPHSHTSYSDGKGTPLEAYEYARRKGLDYLIVSDHSNWMDGVENNNYEYDAATNQYIEKENSEWYKTRKDAEAINAKYNDFLALRGFEMTSSSWGHSNVINSSNYVEAKKQMKDLSDYYKWLLKQPDIVAAFNHPNWPDDSFNDLAYNPELDRILNLIEVGNGAPPYSYARAEEHYFKALDNGWHVGAINGQDNHSTNWGDPDNLTVVIAEELTTEAFMDAFLNRRVYSTETRGLRLTVKGNGKWMGSVLDVKKGDTINFEVIAEDAGAPIKEIQLITNGGRLVDKKVLSEASSYVKWEPKVTAGGGAEWFVIKVIHDNGKWGTASPIFTPTTENDVKLTGLKVDPDTTIPGYETKIEATVTNMGIRDASGIELKFYENSVSEANLIGRSELSLLRAGENKNLSVTWKPKASGPVEIIVKMTEIPGITTVTEMRTTVKVVASNGKTILIDKAHENAEVTGSLLNFMELLRRNGYNVKVNEAPITLETLKDVDVLVVNTPKDNTTNFTDSEEKAISEWVRNGGAAMLASKSNFNNDSTLMNGLMEEMGSGIRFNDDNVYEPEDSDKYSGGMVWSIYCYNLPKTQSGLNDNMEAIRIFSGCSLVSDEYKALANNPNSGLEILLGGNATSYNYNPGKNAHVYNVEGELNGESIPIIAKENIGKGRIVAAGRYFYSDYEVVNDVSNTALTLRLIDYLAGVERIRSIRDVRENAKEGDIVTVKGTVTAPTDNFFDVIYIQDETSGVCLYGTQNRDLPIGTEVIATGVVKYFEGELEIEYGNFDYEILYVGPTEKVKPRVLSTKDAMSPQYTGMLVTTKGKVVEHSEEGSYFKIDDGSGVAYIHVDGYVGADMSRVKVGDHVEVTGIASIGAAGSRIRVRFFDDIKVTGKTITIFHTNDTHSRVTEGDGMGFAKIASIVNEYRKNNPGTLLLDAGDTFHGQTFATISKGKSIVELMNLMGYDAMTPGNHDFNYGYERLLELESMANFPILSSNIYKADGSRILTPYVIRNVDGVRVAIFGLSTPETTYKTHPDNVKGLTFKDPVEEAKAVVAELKGKADVIIALAHLGLDEGSDVTSEDVAKGVAGIDVIVDGHSHSELKNGKLVGDTLIVSANEYDKYLGRVELVLDTENKLLDKKASLISKNDAGNVTPDSKIIEKIAAIEDEQNKELKVVIGRTDVRLDGERELVRKQETNLGNLITDAMIEVTGADVALTNGGGIRASIEAGDITKGDVITVLPFGNYIVTKRIKGSAIKEALEFGVRVYPDLNGGFPHVAGMSYVIDPSKPEGQRVVQILIKGQPINLDREYVLATNDFMAAGGDGYTMFGDYPILNEYAGLDEALISYISKRGTVSPRVEGRITVGTAQVIVLDEVAISIDSKDIKVGKYLDININAKLSNGEECDLSMAKITYYSSNPNVVSIKDNKLYANTAGSAEIWVEVELNGIKVTSNKIAVNVQAEDPLPQTGSAVSSELLYGFGGILIISGIVLVLSKKRRMKIVK